MCTLADRGPGGGQGGLGSHCVRVVAELDSAWDPDHHVDHGLVLNSIREQGPVVVIQPIGGEDQVEVADPWKQRQYWTLFHGSSQRCGTLRSIAWAFPTSGGELCKG